MERRDAAMAQIGLADRASERPGGGEEFLRCKDRVARVGLRIVEVSS
jgi:hypothetical protein